ncbi:low molecular weight phosphatase family protein [Candidatus Woesearchaeota archaeon]|nr:low molecular weight phosphatase family protein [Candidatus Woesearchaeota archaeon]
MKILFVCHGNAHRSPLAEALLKKLRPDLEIDSAGLHVAIPVSMRVREYLAKQKAVEYLKDFPQSIYEKNLREYDLIVAMKRDIVEAVAGKCPECGDRIVDWNIDDPYFLGHEDAERIYKQIENKVKELAKTV